MSRIWIALFALGCVGTAKAAELAPVTKSEESAWLDRLIPLPHEISISHKAIVSHGDISVRLRAGADSIERQAAMELRQVLGIANANEPVKARLEVLIGVLDDTGGIEGASVANAERLKELPHKDQAYLIQPSGENGLILAAAGPKGVYYAVQTLRQLLEGGVTKDRIVIPLATVVDWPDMDERGLWNNDLDMIPWLSSLKLNFEKVPTHCQPVKRDQPVCATIASTRTLPNVLEAARLRAMHPVATVAHLNYIGHSHKAYEAYPELAGKGDGAVPNCGFESRNIRVPCGSSPILKRIIAEYMQDIIRQGADEISVWLSEHAAQCQCEPCLKAGQFRTETVAACEAWQEVRKQHPGVGLRLFYCMGGKSPEDTLECLMALPPEVRIERCYGKFGEAFDAAAAKGRWLASYAGPPLPGAQYSGMRFHGASTTKQFVSGLCHRKWQGVYSVNYVYSTQGYQKGLYGFHVAALAEWTWNVHGRAVKDFARAWATREGYAEPKSLAEWVERMDPIEHELAATLASPLWTKVPQWLQERQAVLAGEGLFAGSGKDGSFDEMLSTCRQALPFAEATGRHEIVLETQYVSAFLQALRSLYQMLAPASRSDPARADTQAGLEAGLSDLRAATADMVRLMNEKTDLLKADPESFADTIKQTHVALWEGRLRAITAAVSPSK